MAFIANTPEDTSAMLAAIGVADVEELFSDLPAAVRLAEPPGPPPLSEYETLRLMQRLAARNNPAGAAYTSYLGAGAYDHFIPAAVQAIAQRGEILTAYTPYQPEASQGTLQIIYEFQSMIGALTGLEVSNASLYDGASALAEAVLMALRATERRQIVLPATLHPSYREVVESYVANLDVEIITWGCPGDGALDAADWPARADAPACLVIPQPNFYGYLEDARELAEAVRSRGGLPIAVVNPMSLSVLAPPGAWGAEIAVGEAQPLGLPLNYGGPYAGFMAATRAQIRRMPGRIVGQTTDTEGRPGFVLTLQTREQHIRREKATSNICTNQGLCATMTTLWMALIGKEGFRHLGQLNLALAGRLFEGLTALPGVEALSDRPFFNEFALRLPIEAERFVGAMAARGILPGLPASRLGHPDPRLIIVCATETKSAEEIDETISVARIVLEEVK